MSIWDSLQMDTKISQVLDIQSHDPAHHFGRPFMTPYQIAMRFKELFPLDFTTIGKQIGGKDTGDRNPLAQYIANELSKRIKDGKITNIEGRFLSRHYHDVLQFKDEHQISEASSKQAYDLSLFRLKE